MARPKLTAQESKFLDLMRGKKQSDTKIMKALSVSRNDGIRLAQSVRTKLGMTPMDSFRTARAGSRGSTPMTSAATRSQAASSAARTRAINRGSAASPSGGGSSGS